MGSVVVYRRGAQREARLRVGMPGRGGRLSQDLVQRVAADRLHHLVQYVSLVLVLGVPRALRQCLEAPVDVLRNSALAIARNKNRTSQLE